MTLYCIALKRPRVLVHVAKQLLLHSLVSALVGQVQLLYFQCNLPLSEDKRKTLRFFLENGQKSANLLVLGTYSIDFVLCLGYGSMDNVRTDVGVTVPT